jgi:hypothetical protein
MADTCSSSAHPVTVLHFTATREKARCPQDKMKGNKDTVEVNGTLAVPAAKHWL